MALNQGARVPPCPGGTLYTIRPGDSFFSLAQRFGTTVVALQRANPGVNPQNLQLGQTVCIPVAPTPGPCPGGFLHQVRPGDTYFRLSQQYGIAVDAIRAANPGVDPNRLAVGQKLCIPAPMPPPPCPGSTYTIRVGDTLSGIARRFGTTVEAILAVNPGLDPNWLQVGRRICLPVGVPGPIPCPQGTIYRVRSGDTLYSLGRRYGVSVSELVAANPHLADPERLQVGDYLCIPRGRG